jgi:DNA primase
MSSYDFNNESLPIEELRQTDIVAYLSKLGFKPRKINNFNYWYLSPLKDEKIPSFKVNRKLNQWYDFGSAKGGNIIDFGILYFNCSVSDFLRQINSPVSPYQPFLKKLQTKL